MHKHLSTLLIQQREKMIMKNIITPNEDSIISHSQHCTLPLHEDISKSCSELRLERIHDEEKPESVMEAVWTSTKKQQIATNRSKSGTRAPN